MFGTWTFDVTPDVFRKLLKTAKGRSEWVVIAVCDVRGFSKFSRLNEAPDAAMFIKRLYLELIDKYFPTATFAKPTGDGLLLIFPFSEENLSEVASTVLRGCFQCVDEFASICASDLMINFDVPEQIGFGITRGPACCLHSGSEILDYSGHLLNLAARLTDLARPAGILVDGRFQAIPSELSARFKKENIYVKSLAETEPISAFCSDHIILPDVALSPIVEPLWRTHEQIVPVIALKTSHSWLGISLPLAAFSKEKIRIELVSDNPTVKGYTHVTPLTKFSYVSESDSPKVRITMDPVLKKLEQLDVPETASVRFRIQFIPKERTTSILPAVAKGNGKAIATT